MAEKKFSMSFICTQLAQLKNEVLQDLLAGFSSRSECDETVRMILSAKSLKAYVQVHPQPAAEPFDAKKLAKHLNLAGEKELAAIFEEGFFTPFLESTGDFLGRAPLFRIGHLPAKRLRLASVGKLMRVSPVSTDVYDIPRVFSFEKSELGLEDFVTRHPTAEQELVKAFASMGDRPAAPSNIFLTKFSSENKLFDAIPGLDLRRQYWVRDRKVHYIIQKSWCKRDIEKPDQYLPEDNGIVTDYFTVFKVDKSYRPLSNEHKEKLDLCFYVLRYEGSWQTPLTLEQVKTMRQYEAGLNVSSYESSTSQLLTNMPLTPASLISSSDGEFTVSAASDSFAEFGSTNRPDSPPSFSLAASRDDEASDPPSPSLGSSRSS